MIIREGLLDLFLSERSTKTLNSDKNNKNSSSLIGGKLDLQYYHSIFAFFAIIVM